MEIKRFAFQNTISRDLVFITALLCILPFISTGYFSTLLGKAVIFAIFAVSLDIAWGYGGILSLGHSVFFGLGAYAFTLCTINENSLSAVLAGVSLGMLLPVLLAALVSWFVFFSKTSPFYIGVVTLSLAVLAERMAVRFSEFTGGQNGISGIISFPVTGKLLYFVIIIIFILVLFLTYRFVNSDMGKLMTAIRDNEERTRFLGYSTPLIRSVIFVLSGALAGFAGVLYAPYNGFISPTLLSFALGTQVIIWTAIGGRGKIVGAVIGALLINVLSPYFNEYFPFVWQVILGLLFIAAVVFFPDGLYSLFSKKRNAEKNYLIETKPYEKAVRDGKEAILAIEDLSVNFGHLSVLKGLNLSIMRGEIQCIIGPNGAGKSTLVNAITGRHSPASGAVSLEGRRIERSRPESIVQNGVARTFQSTTIIRELTVAENLQLAAAQGKFPSIVKNTSAVFLPETALKLFKICRLDEKLTLPASRLSHGDQQMLELCMALALEPKVLLLDEPTAGLTKQERTEIGKILKKLAHEENLALIVIEHDVDFVKEIADRITVLYDGSIAADGTVEEITQNELVKRVYLGGN